MYKVVYGVNDNESEVVVSTLEDADNLKGKINYYTDYCYVREVIPVDRPVVLWTIREKDNSYEIEFSGLTNTLDGPIVSTSLVDGHKFAIVANDDQDAALAIGIQLIEESI